MGVRVKDKTLLPGEGHDWLAHRAAVLTLVVCGRLDEGFPEGTQRCSPWELHFKPRGVLHTTATGPEGTRMLLVNLRDSALDRLESLGLAKPRVISSGVHAARTLGLFQRLASSRCEAPKPSAMASLCRDLGRQPWQRDESELPAWIREVRRKIRDEQGERRTLADLAADFDVHPVYLARAFRRHYGRSIGETRRRLRVDDAVRKLASGHNCLSGLALELGYADQSHFTREFKRETGWTPGRFRDTARALGRIPSR